MTRKIYSQPVYLWNAQSSHQAVVEKYTLLISCKTDGSEVKYSLDNDLDKAINQRLSEADLLFLYYIINLINKGNN